MHHRHVGHQHQPVLGDIKCVDDLTTEVTARKLLFYGAATLGLAVFGGVFRFLQRRIMIGASRDIEFDLRNDFFARLQLFEPAYFHRNRTGDLVTRPTTSTIAHDDR